MNTNLTEDEFEELKHKDIEVYLILRYGSIHDGLVAWQEIQHSIGAEDDSVEKYFTFLDTIIGFRDKGLK